ncbi:unnamed protein product [Heligmosomoides polygyrus]|uniref:Uncharacterized protein n=1 Tax=Heligmosomoides polygyrus TaxID=6339 RepID=A0A183G894_HELPZ|nr:unnamed protein product [Heligmosomoides polygyrus]
MVSSFAPPNIPVLPRNGMIRTYDNQDRTFTRPYSAKTVFFYKEGDEYFTDARFMIRSFIVSTNAFTTENILLHGFLDQLKCKGIGNNS